MTTDTFPKAAARETAIGGKPVTIAGIAKGSGMIAPDMATMLSFVFTDARLPAELLQSLLRQGTDKSLRSEEQKPELQSPMRLSSAVFCLQKKKKKQQYNN